MLITSQTQLSAKLKICTCTHLMDNQSYSEILNYFTSTDKKYPEAIYCLSPQERVDAKSKFRQRVKPYVLKNGILMHGDQELLQASRLSTVLRVCHDNPSSGGHFGRDKTYNKIASRYYWKGT